MANPNIVAVTSIYGNTAYVLPSTTSATTSWTYNGTTSLTGLTPAASTVNRVTSIVVANVTASAATATVQIANNATFGSGTAYTIAYQITVPPNASVIVTDKTTSFYVTENQSVAVTSGTASALAYTATFEAIS
jgi:F0F1-type ATP synthase assembly protein I